MEQPGSQLDRLSVSQSVNAYIMYIELGANQLDGLANDGQGVGENPRMGVADSLVA
jgi:hypothetical protein